MDLLDLGWRDGVMLLAAVAAAYLLLTTLRLVRLRRRRPDLAAPIAPAVPAAELDLPDAAAQWPPRWASQWGGSAEEVATAAAAGPVDAAPEPPAPTGFDEHLASSRIEIEVRQLREEVTNLRRELSELKAARRVSPQYADAMNLARRGYDAQTIAAECGLAVAEAELVLAMSRDEMRFDGEVDHGEPVGGSPGPAGH